MPAAFDEMKGTGEDLRPAYVQLAQWLEQVPKDFLQHRLREAELLFRRTGITFSVYGDESGTERLIPSDLVPRIISGAEWRRLSRGIERRYPVGEKVCEIETGSLDAFHLIGEEEREHRAFFVFVGQTRNRFVFNRRQLGECCFTDRVFVRFCFRRG